MYISALLIEWKEPKSNTECIHAVEYLRKRNKIIHLWKKREINKEFAIETRRMIKVIKKKLKEKTGFISSLSDATTYPKDGKLNKISLAELYDVITLHITNSCWSDFIEEEMKRNERSRNNSS